MGKSGISRGTNPAGVGAGIASERLKNSVAIPNQNDVNAKMFKDLSGSFGAKSGDRPRGGWRNAASGFFAGLEHVENSKSTAKKTEKAEQYDKVMEYLQEVNNSTIERNEWFEKQEYARKQTLPSVLAYMNNIDKLDPQSQFLMAQNILTQYSSATGEPLKLVSIGGSNPNMVTVEGENGVSVLDLSTLFAGNDALDEQIAHKSVDYQLALQEKRDTKTKELDMKEKELKAKYPSYGKEDEEGGQEKTLDIGGHFYKVGDLSRVEKTARSEYQKKVYKEIDAIPKNNQALEAIETMREVFERNPNIGTSMINMLDNPDGTDSWWNIFGRKLSGDDLSDMEILKKATNDLNLDTILGISGKAATDLLKKAVQAASPSGKLTKKGFDVNADKWEKKAREANELALAKYEAMQKGLSLVANPRGASNAIKPQTVQSNANDMNENEDSPFGGRWKKVQ
jgi:hypothetical protein